MDKIIVERVEIDANGIRQLLKGNDVQAELKRICDTKAAEIESSAQGGLHSPKSGSMFVSKVKVLPNCAIGLIVSKGGTGRAGRAKDAKKTDVAQLINKKRKFIHW